MPQPQVDLLLERLRPVIHRRAGLAIGLWGETGIGKSHILSALLSRLPCPRGVAAVRDGPAAWVAALPRPRKTSAWAERSLQSLAAGEPLAPADLAAAMAMRLKGLAPFVLLLEDADPADAATMAVLKPLAEAVGGMRGVALLVSAQAPMPAPFIPAQVTPLTPDELATMLVTEAGGELPPAALVWLQDKVAGHPLYALEYLRYLGRLGHLWNDGQRWRWRPPEDDVLPGTVEALVEQRLQQAGTQPADRDALDALALLGDGAAPDLWLKVAGLRQEELEAASGRLSEAGVLRANEEDGERADSRMAATDQPHRFSHPLLRQVAVKALDAPRRQALARRAVQALEDTPLEAARFVEAAALPPDEALRLLQAAAAAAPTPLTAARLRGEACRFAQGSERARLALEAAQVLLNHDPAEGLRLMLFAAEDPDTRPDALASAVQLLAMVGRRQEAEGLIERLGEEGSAAIKLRPAFLRLAITHMSADYQGAWAIWESEPELQTAGFDLLWRQASWSAVATGRMDQARALLDRVDVPALPEGHRCELYSISAMQHFHAGDAVSAEAASSQALTHAVTLGASRIEAMVLLNHAAILRALGRFEAMGDTLERSLHLREGMADGKAYAYAAAALAELRIEQGRLAEADDLLVGAIATLERYGTSHQLTVARTVASKLGTAQGTPLSRLAGLQQIERAMGEARQVGNARMLREVLIDAALAYAADGQSARAKELALASREQAEAAGALPAAAYRELWALGWAQQELGQAMEAEASLSAALELARAHDGGLEHHKIGLLLARQRNDVEAARGHLTWFETNGLGLGASMARRLFPELEEPADEASQEALSAGLRLDVLGPIRLGGGPLRGEKRRMILAALLEARVVGQGGLTKLELLDLLYPGQDEIKATASLRELVHGLRRGFGAEVVLTTPDGYALGGGGSDLEQFLIDPAAVVWRGTYLEGLELDGPVRDTLHQQLARHVRELIQRDAREAARLGSILVAAEPYRFDFLAVALEAMRAAGNHRSLGRRYEAARDLAAELGHDLPQRWQDFLAESGPPAFDRQNSLLA